MLKINKMILGEYRTNCYVVWDDVTNDAIIIDPAEDADRILEFIKINSLNVWAVLLTHGHFDHIGACYDLQNEGIDVYIHENDAKKCTNNNLNMSTYLSISKGIKTFTPNVLIKGQTNNFNFGSIEVVVINTPGHSSGSCSYVVYEDDDSNKKESQRKHLFSGDAIFENGEFGRFDFPDGNLDCTIKTVKLLREMVANGHILHSGH